jgi:hypothetical protein
MDYIIANNEDNPSVAQIVVDDFCFFAGTPNQALIVKSNTPIIVPRNESFFGGIYRERMGERSGKNSAFLHQKKKQLFLIMKS